MAQYNANSSFDQLGDQIISTLQKNSSFIRNQHEIIRSGKVVIDENMLKQLRFIEKLHQEMINNMNFLANAFLNDGIKSDFILKFLVQLMEVNVCENDLVIECCHTLLITTLPKLACDSSLQGLLTSLIQQLQTIVNTSNIYSMPVKELVKDIVIMGKHRFGFKLEVFKNHDNLRQNVNLNNLREQHQQNINH